MKSFFLTIFLGMVLQVTFPLPAQSGAKDSAAKAGCSVSGKVVDALGKPVSGAEVTLKEKMGGREFFAKTDARGAFLLSGIKPGSYLVLVRKQGVPAKISEWELPQSTPATRRVEMPVIGIGDEGGAVPIPPQLAGEFQEVLKRMRQGNYDGAAAVIQKIAGLQPENADILYMLGVAYNKSQKFTEALAPLNRVTELRPGFAGGYYELGMAYHNLNQLRPALQNYQRALALEPERPEINYNTGLILLQLNQSREALGHFDQALKAQPDDPDILAMAARCQIDLGAFPQALENLEKARKSVKDPEKAKSLDTLIALIKARGKK